MDRWPRSQCARIREVTLRTAEPFRCFHLQRNGNAPEKTRPERERRRERLVGHGDHQIENISLIFFFSERESVDASTNL